MAIIACKLKIKTKYFLALPLSGLFLGCTVVEKPFKLKEDVINYSEAIFRRQNHATQQVMMLIEDDITFAEEEVLSAAELKMYDACHLLNEAAGLEMEGKEISLNFQRLVIASLNDCDASVINMESTLESVTEIINTKWADR